MLQIGITGRREVAVTEGNTAKALGSGELEVFATPAMVALVEETAWRSVAPALEPGQGSVGTRLELDHVSATPLGMTVACETVLVEIDGRRLVFAVQVMDAGGLVGKGTHERFVVQNDRFLAKAARKTGEAAVS